jgi:hypothetical protein
MFSKPTLGAYSYAVVNYIYKIYRLLFQSRAVLYGPRPRPGGAQVQVPGMWAHR